MMTNAILFLVGVLVLGASFAGAQTRKLATASPVAVKSASPRVASTAQAASDMAQAAAITRLKGKAKREIDRRLAALTHVATKIEPLKHLSAEQKQALTEAIQSEIASLTALKTKIDAATDIATMRTDVASIAESYRIFALVISRTHLLVAADAITNASAALTEVAGRLEIRINDQAAAGKNVTELKTLVSDMKSKSDSAKTRSQEVRTAVLALTPAGYPGNKQALQTANRQLELARKDVVTARLDGKLIENGLFKLQKTN